MKAINMEAILSVCEKIMYFFVVNLLFLACNLPVLLFFLFVGISQVRTCLPLFLVSMIPFAPAFSAVLYCMNRVAEKTETGVVRDFKKGYASEWGQKIRLGAGQALAILVFYTSLEFFLVQVPFLPCAILMGLFFVGSILITPILYFLSVRYQASLQQTVKNAVILLVTKPGLTLGNAAGLALILMLIEIQAGTAVLFMGSVYGFLVVYMSRRILKSFEESQ